MITPRPPLLGPIGWTDRLVGDSVWYGVGASNIGVTDAQSLLCAERGWARQNNCVSGSGSHGALMQAYANYQAFGGRLAVNNRKGDGHNNGIYYNALTPSTVAGGDRAWFALIWARTDMPASAMTMVGTGWTASATDYGDKASTMLGGTPMQTSVVGDKITWTAATSHNIFINCPSGPGAGGRRIGSFDVKQNGVVVDSYNGDGQGNNSTLDGNPPLTCHARFIFDVKAGDTFEIVNTGGAGPMINISVGTLCDPWDCENGVRELPPRPSSACLSGGYYQKGSNTGSPAGFDAIDDQIFCVVELLANRNYRARVGYTNSIFNGSATTDGEHANDTGQMQIYNSSRKVYQRADQVPVIWTSALHSYAISPGGTYTMPQCVGLRDGKSFEYWIRLDPASGTTLTSTKGSTYVDPPANIFMAAASTADIVGCSTGMPHSVGLANNSWPGKIFLPDAVIAEATQIYGRCLLA
jgi:hypothetical protein